MKVFDQTNLWPTKVNFMDENNVMLGYDMEQNCCEQAGWFISNRVESKVVAGLTEDQYCLDNFVFDPRFKASTGDGDEMLMAIFRVHDGDDELFIHLHNTHNGYYSHGFSLAKDEQVIESGDL